MFDTPALQCEISYEDFTTVGQDAMKVVHKCSPSITILLHYMHNKDLLRKYINQAYCCENSLASFIHAGCALRGEAATTTTQTSAFPLPFTLLHLCPIILTEKFIIQYTYPRTYLVSFYSMIAEKGLSHYPGDPGEP